MDSVRQKILDGYVKHFREIFSIDFQKKIHEIETSYYKDCLLNSITIVFNKPFDTDFDKALVYEAVRCACFAVFPSEIIKAGILIDCHTKSIELRFGINPTEWKELATTPRKPLDIN